MENCIRCVNAWGLRRLGYDVSAVPGQPGISAESSTTTWRDSKGNRPKWVHSDAGDHGVKWNDVRSEIDGVRDGAFGFVSFKLSRRYSHVVAWEKKNGALELIDPQNTSYSVEAQLAESVPGSIKWVNLYGFKPTQATVTLVRESMG